MNGKTMMVANNAAQVLCAVLFLCGACDPNEDLGIDGIEGFGGDSDEPLAYAVRSSDYSSTSIALLNPDGSMLDRAFIHSGSVPAGLSSALSGDVALPTRSGDGQHLTTIDRYSTDIVTRIDVATGEVLGQVKTHTPPKQGEDSFSSNPQDYLYLDEDNAWVTRLGVDPRTDDDDVDHGSDLLHVDPSAFKRTGARIDLSEFDSEGEVENPDTGETQSVAIYARPERMVRVGEQHAIVGLARLSLGYDAVAPGMVALANLDTHTVEGFELEGLSDCGQVAPIPGTFTRVAVSCVGFFRGEPRDGAGIAIVAFEDGELSVERIWRARDDEDSALAVYGLTALSEHVVVATAAGVRESDTPNDRLYRIDLDTGKQTRVFEAKGAYTIGDGAFNPSLGLLMVPDASTDADGVPTAGVRMFEVDEDMRLEEASVLAIDDALPARQVKPL